MVCDLAPPSVGTMTKSMISFKARGNTPVILIYLNSSMRVSLEVLTPQPYLFRISGFLIGEYEAIFFYIKDST
jgi:hypothetical protein